MDQKSHQPILISQMLQNIIKKKVIQEINTQRLSSPISHIDYRIINERIESRPAYSRASETRSLNIERNPPGEQHFVTKYNRLQQIKKKNELMEQKKEEEKKRLIQAKSFVKKMKAIKPVFPYQNIIEETIEDEEQQLLSLDGHTINNPNLNNLKQLIEVESQKRIDEERKRQLRNQEYEDRTPKGFLPKIENKRQQKQDAHQKLHDFYDDYQILPKRNQDYGKKFYQKELLSWSMKKQLFE